MNINPRATHLLVRHQEIALKGKNRPDFERRLMGNLHKLLPHGMTVQNLSGRFLIPLAPELLSQASALGDATLNKLIEQLSRVSGVTAITPCRVTAPDIEFIKTHALDWATHELETNPDAATFAVRIRRIDKHFPLRSAEAELNIGSAIKKLKPGLVVNLKKPDIKVAIEIRHKHALIYSDEMTGAKGLPMDATQRVVVLLSGGIDSPVAAYEIMRRGCSPVFVHFHSKPFTSEARVEKVKRLAKVLKEFSPFPMELWLVPLLEVQKAVRDACNERYRTIHYRRFMMMIAQEFAHRRGAKALVTGDALGQVASQTLTNLHVVGDAVQIPVLRPLITMDKATIIAKAQQLGTFEISIEPHDDTCVLFAPNRPATQARLSSVREEAQALPQYELIFAAADAAEKILITGRE